MSTLLEEKVSQWSSRGIRKVDRRQKVYAIVNKPFERILRVFCVKPFRKVLYKTPELNCRFFEDGKGL